MEDDRNEASGELGDYTEILSRNFRGAVEDEVDHFVKSMTAHFSIPSGNVKMESLTHVVSEDIKQLEAELEVTHAMIEVLRGALRVATSIIEKYVKEKQ